MKPQERGDKAAALIRDGVFQEALTAASDSALREFAASTTPEEAWKARQLMQVTEEFAAYLMAVIQLGKADVSELMAKRQKKSRRQLEKETVVDYLNTAREARENYLESLKGVA